MGLRSKPELVMYLIMVPILGKKTANRMQAVTITMLKPRTCGRPGYTFPVIAMKNCDRSMKMIRG
jgi:hypothetical protein